MLKFLKSKTFLINLSIAAVAMCLLLYIVFAWLGSYTHHGEKLAIPDLHDKSLEEAIKILDEQGLKYKVEDSVYVENALPGMIVAQVPDPFFTDPKTGEEQARYVKEGRRIYLTINKLRPPKIGFPNLVGKSKRIALGQLKNMGMDMEIVYQTSSTGNDFVLAQKINGRTIRSGEKIEVGSKITIVLSKTSTKTVYAPKLIGLKVVNAQNKLNNKSLNIGRITGDCTGCKNRYDTLNAYIVKQYPEWDIRVKEGGEVEVEISTEKPK